MLGGTKVDAFIYSPLLSSSVVNRTYDGLFHISDWFPTLLSLTGVKYTPIASQSIDGIDQSKALKALAGDSVTIIDAGRTYVLYNLYYNVQGKNYDINVNGSFAIRDTRYKLMHGYSGPESDWYSEYAVQPNDDIANVGDCFPVSTDSLFTYYLFDLKNDPNETINLYADPQYADIKVSC